MINKHKSNKRKENSNTVRHLNNGTDHRQSKSCCDQRSPACRTINQQFPQGNFELCKHVSVHYGVTKTNEDNWNWETMKLMTQCVFVLCCWVNWHWLWSIVTEHRQLRHYPSAFQWRHNDGVSNQRPLTCLLHHLLRHRSKKTPKLRIALTKGQ